MDLSGFVDMQIGIAIFLIEECQKQHLNSMMQKEQRSFFQSTQVRALTRTGIFLPN